MKKYKYTAPKDIGIKDSQWQHLRLIDGKIVKVISEQAMFVEVSLWNYDYPVFKVYAGDLQEIKEESKVLSAEEWACKQPAIRFPANNENWHLNKGRIEGFEAGDKNGQLKRDLVYRPLVDAVNEFVKTGSSVALAKICEELRNIPLLED